MILAISMLFANISFVFADGESTNNSVSDSEVINKLMEVAVYTSITKRDRPKYGSDPGKELDYPTIIITDEMIETVKQDSGYKGDIYIRDCKIFMKEEGEEEEKEYKISLGSSPENYLAADSEDSDTYADYYNTCYGSEGLKIEDDDGKEAYKNATGTEYNANGEQGVYIITFAGAALRDDKTVYDAERYNQMGK